jgi:hypothetical protein
VHAEHVLKILRGELGKIKKIMIGFAPIGKPPIRFFIFFIFWYILFTFKNSKNDGFLAPTEHAQKNLPFCAYSACVEIFLAHTQHE